MLGNKWKEKYPNLSNAEYKKRIEGNKQILLQLSKHGDNPTTERDVLHYVYFTDINDCNAFQTDVIALGYEIKSTQASLGIVVTSHHQADKETVDAVVLQLLNLAVARNGDYDGWETKICK
ncbi:ribonuclease E inhibitor RraB [Eubacteriales bacterium OttesenSCG-928-N14]|nr:ribonuclease E inhibitor RraB [Eubacteriales bacterium OttesenSCG-928-N14]